MKAINFYKLILVKEKEAPYGYGDGLTSPNEVAKLAIDVLKMGQFAEEYMYLVALSTKNQINGLAEIGHGILNNMLVHPREVYKYAISMNAASIILIHNHPSGNPTPSIEDIEITRRLKEAGDLLGIQLLDHVIVADGGFVSMKERGII